MCPDDRTLVGTPRSRTTGTGHPRKRQDDKRTSGDPGSHGSYLPLRLRGEFTGSGGKNAGVPVILIQRTNVPGRQGQVDHVTTNVQRNIKTY